MRILFVLPFVPYPPSDGARMKMFNLLKYLSPRHRCDLICLDVPSQKGDERLRTALPQIGTVRIVPCVTRIRRYFGAVKEILCLNPPSLARFASRDLQDMLATELTSRKYDVVHYDIINMVQYHTDPFGIASVHSPNDATSCVYFRLAGAASDCLLKCKLYFSAVLLRRYERKTYGTFSKIHVVSAEDKKYLNGVTEDLDVEVIPISSGYPYDIFVAPVSCARTHEDKLGPIIVACGNFGDAAIARGFSQFLQEAFPYIRKEFPDVRLRVLGKRVAAGLLRRMQAVPNIEYFSWVEEFDTFITNADVVLVPDMAGAPGAKTRVVQAMALGMPVVGSVAAFEGVPATNEVHGMIYSTSEQCVASMLDLFRNEGQRRRLGAAAAVLAANEYSLDRIGPQYEMLYYAAKERHRNIAGRHFQPTDRPHSGISP